MITEYEPGRRLMARTTAGHVVEPDEQGTKYTFIVEGESGGPFKLAEPLLLRIASRQVRINLLNLKDLLEAGVDREE